MNSNTTKTDKIQRVVLGSILLEDRAFYEVSDIINPVMFSGWLGAVATLVWDQMESEGKVSAAVLAHDAQAKHQIQESAIYELIQFANPKSLKQDADKLKLEYYREQEILIHHKAIEKLQKGLNPDQVISDSQLERDLIHDFSEDENQTRAGKLNDWLERILTARDGKTPVGILTPFEGLNRRLGGLHPTNYTLLAARPGAGKTTFLLDVILHAVRNKIPTLFHSLEMSYYELISLLAQKVTGVPNRDMRAGKVTELDIQKIQGFMSEMYELPIFIETGVNALSDLKYKTRMYKRKYGIKLVCIDYIQRMHIRDFRGNRNAEIETISRSLKDLVNEKDCNASLLTLSQLSRSVETRSDKRPQLSDLRDSGSLEQDADNIFFMYRPDYYYEHPEDEQGNSLKGIVELICAKNRHVSDGLGKDFLKYDPQHNILFDKPEKQQPEELEPNITRIDPTKVNVNDPIPF